MEDLLMTIYAVGVILVGAFAAVRYVSAKDDIDKTTYGMMFVMAFMWPLAIIMWMFGDKK